MQTQLLSPRSGGKGPEGMRFRVKREMLACFEDGLSARFFAAWDKHVPMDLRDNDKTARKLEFNLQLHFATLPFRPTFLRKMAQAQRSNPRVARSAAGAAASAMINFRKYLESRGKVLSNSPEFLQYYALPYVPNPVEHPSFKAVFKPQWPLDIRIRVERFLEVVLQSVTLPELYQVFDNSNNLIAGIDGPASRAGGGASLAGNADEVRRVREQVREQFLSREDKLKDFARNIYAVSVEMLRELERAASRSGQQVRPEFVTFAKVRDSQNHSACGCYCCVPCRGFALAGMPPAPVFSSNRFALVVVHKFLMISRCQTELTPCPPVPPPCPPPSLLCNSPLQLARHVDPPRNVQRSARPKGPHVPLQQTRQIQHERQRQSG